MEAIKGYMINQARKKYKKIFPCKATGSLQNSFTFDKNRIYFWFNTKDQSTHVQVYTLPTQ